MCSLLIAFASSDRGVGGKCIYKHFMMELFDQCLSNCLLLAGRSVFQAMYNVTELLL